MDAENWDLIRTERLTLADLLESLDDQQWQTRSLCTEWTVHDVAAHLLMTPAGQPRPWAMTKALVRARGHLWTAGRDVAIAFGRRPHAELVSGLRAHAASRTKPAFVVDANILLDLLVHGQDIAVPLGVVREVPPAAARAGLDRVWSTGWPFHARRRLEGVRLRTDDGSWQAGAGPEVVGSAAALLLLTTGRTAAALPLLDGPGLPVLQRRLAPTGRG
ncbi:maleylpyruvate isomerase family mycothiol-dependent enzyme [Nocardioides koreensis]|uniref:Maleylpyruvate isomerase family mycothiol-dependent enzyme n=1 Tax=Nocardioides koreensis TaxID=433651 RepID=A0ABN2ZPZ9_9ACTN